MRNCPLCGNELGESAIVCSACVEKIALNEPKRREARLRHVADTLLVFIAVFLFLKGAFAMWEMGGYANFVQSLGFPVGSWGLHYLNASICILAALGYAITALGNYMGKEWTLKLCLGTLCVFVGCQAVVQFADIHEEYSFTKALSVILFLAAVPTLQYVMSVMGTASGKAAPVPAGAAAAPPEPPAPGGSEER
jgi:predicted nucleic acid-binding Zn ribbon protein